MTELEILASQIGVSDRTLRRALTEGTFRAERPTPRTLKLEAAERRYIRRHWNLLASLRKTLRTEQNVRFALLFGSAARGEGTAISDVDLLVEMRDSSLIRIADLGMKLESALGLRVDVVTLDAARANPHLLAQALGEGRVLVDRGNRWPSLSSEAGEIGRRARVGANRAKRRALSGIDRMLAADVS